MTKVVLSLLIAFSAPLFLLPVEQLLPYPYFIEEAVKLVVVVMILKAVKTPRGWPNGLPQGGGIWVILAGILFTISESIFYLVNIFASGNLMLFPERLILTGTLHLGTILLLYVSVKRGRIWAMGGIGSVILIHYLYNSLIGSF